MPIEPEETVALKPPVGPAVKGFKRSPALLEHIRFLSIRPDIDLFIKHPDRFVPSTNLFTPITKLVRDAREKAMTTGDRETVAKLCHYAVWWCLAMRLDKDAENFCDVAINRMGEEYEYPKLKDAVMELQRLQYQDPVRRP